MPGAREYPVGSAAVGAYVSVYEREIRLESKSGLVALTSVGLRQRTVSICDVRGERQI